jgi:hypothetical protein
MAAIGAIVWEHKLADLSAGLQCNGWEADIPLELDDGEARGGV